MSETIPSLSGDNFPAAHHAGSIPLEHVQVKRAYEAPAQHDGTRILIDRLWPRGMKKEALVLDKWDKELAPSTELRKWFGHDPAHWKEFQRRYAEELGTHSEALEAVRALASKGRITLIYSAHDEAHNTAVALRNIMLSPETQESHKKAAQPSRDVRGQLRN